MVEGVFAHVLEHFGFDFAESFKFGKVLSYPAFLCLFGLLAFLTLLTLLALLAFFEKVQLMVALGVAAFLVDCVVLCGLIHALPLEKVLDEVVHALSFEGDAAVVVVLFG